MLYLRPSLFETTQYFLFKDYTKKKKKMKDPACNFSTARLIPEFCWANSASLDQVTYSARLRAQRNDRGDCEEQRAYKRSISFPAFKRDAV